VLRQALEPKDAEWVKLPEALTAGKTSATVQIQLSGENGGQ
jgi:hypothetical protein